MAISDWGIGIIGLGGISLTHLEAYKRRGFNVIAGADPNDRNFETIRTRFGLTQLFEDAANVIALDEVRILDVTVPHRQSIRKPIVEAGAQAGKALFIQKPLASSFQEAKELVEIAERRGVALMVNQNSVFVPGFLAMEPYLRNHIGTPYYFQIENRAWVNPGLDVWYGKHKRWVGLDMAIHHFALADYWFGDWETVYAMGASDPSQRDVCGDTVVVVNVKYAQGVQGVILNNWCYRGDLNRPHAREEVVIQGDKGTISGTSQSICVVVDDPVPSKIYPQFSGDWFPDAFGNSMMHFIEALDSSKPFLCSGRHNLKAMALMEGAYRSLETKTVVTLKEIYAEG